MIVAEVEQVGQRKRIACLNNTVKRDCPLHTFRQENRLIVIRDSQLRGNRRPESLRFP